MHVKYLIIGAGPTGLGAGHRLRELGETSVLLLEKNAYTGGLAASFKDSAGFTWDLGGHVVFSHYAYFDRLIEDLLGDAYLEHQRIAMVRMLERWVPYPFQNNLRHLPREVQWEIVEAMLPGRRPEKQPANFREWMDVVFGAGIAKYFMVPYNFKVWATPAEMMAYHWIGERVSVVNLEMVLKNLLLELDNKSWGPNNVFRFPLFGGTGEIFTRLGDRLGDMVRRNTEVVSVDAQAKVAETSQGERITYEYLLNTGPLDQFVLQSLNTPNGELREAAGRLAHNSVFVAGVGVDGMRDDPTCWMYFPEDNAPFYRVTNFHNYSPNNAAKPGASRALMCEISYSRHKKEDLSQLMESTVQGLVNTALMDEKDRDNILSRWSCELEYGYPVPTLERDPALRVLQPWLESRDIYSRGRFGGWQYEAANMDHSVMQGVEWAERMVLGSQETTYVVK